MAPLPNDLFYSARILERREISDDLWVIRVDPGGDFKYLPGQFATLGNAGETPALPKSD